MGYLSSGTSPGSCSQLLLELHGMPVHYLNENENEVSPENENEILQLRPRYQATSTKR